MFAIYPRLKDLGGTGGTFSRIFGQFFRSSNRNFVVFLPGHLLELIYLSVLQSGLLQDICTQFFGEIGNAQINPRPTQNHRFAEQTFCSWHGCSGAHFGAATGLPHDGYIVGVAAKVGNVVAYPFQGGHQIQHPHITGGGVFFSSYARKVGKTKRPQAVVDGAKNHISEPSQVFSFVAFVLNGIAIPKPAAVHPQEDGAFFAVAVSWCKNVDAQTIFADIVVVPLIPEGCEFVGVAVFHLLWSRVAPPQGRVGVGPGLGFLWRHKTVGSRGIRSVGNAHEMVNVPQNVAAHFAIAGIGQGNVVPDEQYLIVLFGWLHFTGITGQCKG